MTVNDIAGYDLAGTYTPELIFAGDEPPKSDAAPALANLAKYEVAALTATGVTTFVVGTHTAAQLVIVAQATTTGKQCPYFNAGKFNHAALIWPNNAALDTYAERRAFCTGTVKVGRIA
ncbi:MAG: hypothetical protein RL268_1670 [Pseudomonadota bacterium]|jgi:hypothetical protein